MLARSAWSRPAAGSPRPDSTPRAIDSALTSARAALSGPRSANSASQARSRVSFRPGETRTSSHSRLALGRGQGPALWPPTERLNAPNSLARTAIAGSTEPPSSSPGTYPLCRFVVAGTFRGRRRVTIAVAGISASSLPLERGGRHGNRANTDVPDPWFCCHLSARFAQALAPGRSAFAPEH